MSDDEIEAAIDRAKRHWPYAHADMLRFAAEIDRQRDLNNLLADQSQRLRALVEGRGKVLDIIRDYATSNADVPRTSFPFALRTIANMVQQCFDTEKSSFQTKEIR